MNAAISETGAEIHVSKLPVITGYIYIKSVFRNLLSNAVKFAKRDERPVIYISSKDLGKEFQFTVKDNGIGIDKIDSEKIFFIFQRLHLTEEYEGMGLGLAYCRKIVELHGGKIWVESEKDLGSAFYFTLSKTG
jgi:light-regulated signal transduction histidine kinase (bacteriophytochrome)